MNQDVAAYPNKTELKFIYTCCKQNIEKDISFGWYNLDCDPTPYLLYHWNSGVSGQDHTMHTPELSLRLGRQNHEGQRKTETSYTTAGFYSESVPYTIHSKER